MVLHHSASFLYVTSAGDGARISRISSSSPRIFIHSLLPTAPFPSIFTSLASFQRSCKLIRPGKHAKEREAKETHSSFCLFVAGRINEENEAKRVSPLVREKVRANITQRDATFKVTFIYSQLNSRQACRVAPPFRKRELFASTFARKGNPLINIGYHKFAVQIHIYIHIYARKILKNSRRRQFDKSV